MTAFSKKISFLFLALFLSFAWGDPNFKKTSIEVGRLKLQVEVADTEELREHGLMGRKSLRDSEGMVFIFSYPQILRFWMKDTLIPLSIGYFDKDGSLFQITDMEPASPIEINPKIYPSEKLAKYALEVPKGWFKRKSISLGSKLKL